MAYIKKIKVYERNSKGEEKKKVTTHRYQVGYYDYGGKKHRRNFPDKKAAEVFKREVELQSYRIKSDLDSPLRPNLKYDDMVEQYLVIIDRQKKPRTIARERTVFRTLRIFIPRNIRIRDINSSLIRHYVEYRLNECRVSPATVNAELRTLKSFMNILITHEYLDKNPLSTVKMVPVVKSDPHIFTDSEINGLLSVIDDQNYLDVITFFLHSGARREELLPPRLSWNDIDFKDKTIRLTGKFDKVRYVPLDGTAYEIVVRRRQNAANKYPFDFNYHYLYKKFKKYLSLAGITHGTLHSIRRCFASKLIQQGTSIHYVSKLLGHNTIELANQAYIHIITNDLRKEVEILDKSW